MSEGTRDRFKDAVWLNYTAPLTLIGVGGIGSWVGLLLYKMGYKLDIFDFDKLEEVNIGSQLYPLSSCGSYKINAFNDVLNFFNSKDSSSVIGRISRFDKDTPINSIVICAVDNMETRELSSALWFEEGNKAEWKGTWLFIDGRMDAETMEVFTLTCAEDYMKYREHLFPDSDVEHAPCSFKATPYTSALIASRITSCIVNHITNCLDTTSKRSVPFYIHEIIPLMLSETNEH